MTVQFTQDPYAEDIILKIAERAQDRFDQTGCGQTLTDTMMDISATNANGCPLRLQELLDADDFNFYHDVFGIYRHIDRTTGTLEGGFLPRFYDSERDTDV